MGTEGLGEFFGSLDDPHILFGVLWPPLDVRKLKLLEELADGPFLVNHPEAFLDNHL